MEILKYQSASLNATSEAVETETTQNHGVSPKDLITSRGNIYKTKNRKTCQFLFISLLVFLCNFNIYGQVGSLPTMSDLLNKIQKENEALQKLKYEDVAAIIYPVVQYLEENHGVTSFVEIDKSELKNNDVFFVYNLNDSIMKILDAEYSKNSKSTIIFDVNYLLLTPSDYFSLNVRDDDRTYYWYKINLFTNKYPLGYNIDIRQSNGLYYLNLNVDKWLYYKLGKDGNWQATIHFKFFDAFLKAMELKEKMSAFVAEKDEKETNRLNAIRTRNNLPPIPSLVDLKREFMDSVTVYVKSIRNNFVNNFETFKQNESEIKNAKIKGSEAGEAQRDLLYLGRKGEGDALKYSYQTLEKLFRDKYKIYEDDNDHASEFAKQEWKENLDDFKRNCLDALGISSNDWWMYTIGGATKKLEILNGQSNESKKTSLKDKLKKITNQ
jgi:hypothetical protein